MNPPFGAASVGSREYLYEALSSAPQDLFAAFVERFSDTLSEGGRMGVISGRLALFKELLAEWRTDLLLGASKLAVVGDLGYGVLDGAVVEAAAYVVERSTQLAQQEQGLFVSVLDTEAKDSGLLTAIHDVANGKRSGRLFVHALSNFLSLPSSIIAYWCSDGWLTRISTWQSAGSTGVVGKRGLETGNHFRLLRLSWEVPPADIVPFQYWTFYSKGGDYRPAHADLHLVFNWRLRDFARRVSNEELYGRTGLTYTERTTSNFASRVLPRGCVFSPAGPGVFPADDKHLWGLLGFLNSSVVGFYIELFVGGGDTSAPGTAARHFSSTFIERLPVPTDFADLLTNIDPIARDYHRQLQTFKWNETAPEFGPRPFGCHTLRDEALRRLNDYESAAMTAIEKFRQLDDMVQNAYNLGGEEKEDIARSFGRIWTDEASPSEDTRQRILGLFLSNDAFVEDEEPEDLGQSRAATKLSFVADRRYETLATQFKVPAKVVASIRKESKAVPQYEVEALASDAISISLGGVFGRWDIRYATGERPAPELPDPFAPLPVCPPGMLQGDEGLPLSPEAGRRLRAEGRYPLDVAWDGILVDDPEHPLDLERRVHAALAVLWAGGGATSPSSDALEHEACALLGVPTLREWFRRPAGFFADHLKRYSKSRRQAPIYWPLSTASGSYTLWLYYHRLNAQTLYTCVTDFVKPKLDTVTADANRLASQTRTGGTAKEREELQGLRDFQAELQELHDELLRVAQLPWKPNLNDGVLITASPLWKLFRLTKWQKDLKACWEELAAGDYDWAHLAHTIWPDRVREKCKKDRSLAIAHGLEDLCEVAAPKPKATKTKKAAKAAATPELPTRPPSARATPVREIKVVQAEAATPTPIDQIDRTEVLCVIRQVFSTGGARDRETAMRDVAQALGFQRLGSHIREVLNKDILTAVRHGILENEDGQLKLLVGDVRDYEREFQKENFLSAIGRSWIEREDAIRLFARWLGYARTGPVIEDTARSLINGLLRGGRLEKDGERIRRVA
jgi:hypothetical protein